MSHKASYWAMKQLPGSPLKKAILLVLADYHTDESGLIFPSASTLSILTCSNERTVRKSLDEMQGDGFLWITPRVGKTPTIQLNFKKPTPDSKSGLVKLVNQEADKQGVPRGQKMTPDVLSGVANNIEKNASTPDFKCSTPDLDSGVPRTLSAATPDSESDEEVISINNNIRLKVYKINPEWDFEESIVRESKELDEVPIEFMTGQLQAWLSYRLADQRKASERTHVLWHQAFAAHVLYHWKIYAKKHGIKTPEFRKKGFDSPEAFEAAKNDFGRRKSDKFAYDNLKKVGGIIPGYLKYLEEEESENVAWAQ